MKYDFWVPQCPELKKFLADLAEQVPGRVVTRVPLASPSVQVEAFDVSVEDIENIKEAVRAFEQRIGSV